MNKFLFYRLVIVEYNEYIETKNNQEPKERINHLNIRSYSYHNKMG